MLCNIINVFMVTFDQFNASLLNKSNFFQKNKSLTDLKLLKISVCFLCFYSLLESGGSLQ